MDMVKASSRLQELKRVLAQPVAIDFTEGDERLNYLYSWIPRETLCILESIRQEVENDEPAIRDFSS